MADEPDETQTPELTPMQRALALKNKLNEAQAKHPRGGRYQRERAAAAQSASRSKPWMKA